MATKKQKRARALEKREAFLARERERGLTAQKEDHERQARLSERWAEEARLEERRLHKILLEHFFLYGGQ